MLMLKASEYIAALRKRVGGGYIKGGSGQICTIALLQAKERQYGKSVGDGYYCKLINGVKDFTRGLCARWLGKWVADCSGLLKAVRRDLGGGYYDVNPQMMWDRQTAERGSISTMPKVPGIALFVKASSGTMGHVGMYVGGGYVIQSSGVRIGIVLSKYGAGWTHWGRLNWMTYDLPADEGTIQPPLPPKPPNPPQPPAATDGVYFTTTAALYTLWDIAKKFGVKWTTIRRVVSDNPEKLAIPNPLSMRAGIKLRIK